MGTLMLVLAWYTLVLSVFGTLALVTGDKDGVERVLTVIINSGVILFAVLYIFAR